MELTLVKGDKIKLTTDDAFMEKCTKDVVWLDYKNITKVIVPGKRIFIDDGLISVVATEIGRSIEKISMLSSTKTFIGLAPYTPQDKSTPAS